MLYLYYQPVTLEVTENKERCFSAIPSQGKRTPNAFFFHGQHRCFVEMNDPMGFWIGVWFVNVLFLYRFTYY